MTKASPHQQLDQMITGYWISQAIYAAAKFRIADLLKNGPRTAEQLAEAGGGCVKRFLRLLIYGTYPFLALSGLFLAGMGFGAGFGADFTVENRTGDSIVVTPVGTVGQKGHKAPLPVVLLTVPPLPALQAGCFGLPPGEVVTIRYDMDDINFSEIVVEDEPGRRFQLVTDPNPTTNQYHGPLQRQYVIDNLSRLDEVTPAVHGAAEAAHRQWALAAVLYLLLFGPWLAYAILTLILRRCDRHRPIAEERQVR
jgi:hypothetical protein